MKGGPMRASGILVVLVVLLVVAAAYMPVMQGNYVYHDDYYAFSVGDSWKTHPQYNAYVNDYGRPLGIYIKYLYAKSIHIARDANVARSVTLLAMACLALLLYRAIRPHLDGAPEAVLLVAMVITLPPFQTPGAMIANATHIYAAILGALAAHIVIWTHKAAAPVRRRLLGGAAAAGLIFVALLAYQPAAFFYLVVVCFFLLYCRYDSLPALVARFCAVVGPLVVASAAYFVYIKTLSSPRAKPTGDIIAKALWFWRTVLPTVFSFWSLKTSRFGLRLFAGLFAFLVVLRGISACFAGKVTDDRPEVSKVLIDLARVVGIAVVGIMSYLPNLAAWENALYYRSLIAIQPFALLVFYALGRGVLRQTAHIIDPQPHRRGAYVGSLGAVVRKAVLVVGLAATAGGIYTAHYNVMNYYVVPQTVELGYLRQQLAELDPSRRHHVHIVRPMIPYLVWRNWEDEYGVPSTLFPQDIGHIVAAINREFGMSLPIHTVTNGSNATEQDFSAENPSVEVRLPVPEDAVIIDMNRIGLLLDPVGEHRWEKRHVTSDFFK